MTLGDKIRNMTDEDLAEMHVYMQMSVCKGIIEQFGMVEHVENILGCSIEEYYAKEIPKTIEKLRSEFEDES